MDRKDFLKAGLVMIGGVWVPKQHAANIVVRGPVVTASSGSAPAWYDSTTVASCDGNKIWNWVDARITKVVPTFSGSLSCTKLRWWVGFNFFGSGATLKLALYDSSRNYITGATSASISASSDQWVEVNITSTSVTSGNTYFIGSVCSTDQLEPRSLSGQPSGSSHIDLGTVYANYPGTPDPFTNAASTYLFAASMYIE